MLLNACQVSLGSGISLLFPAPAFPTAPAAPANPLAAFAKPPRFRKAVRSWTKHTSALPEAREQ